jgi:DNA-binding FadR family transcriptional regulator
MPEQVWAQTAERILSGLRDGTYPAGSRLPGIVPLAGQLGVSTSSVRSALGLLARSGWLDVRPGGGHYVPAGPDVPSTLADHERRITRLEQRR